MTRTHLFRFLLLSFLVVGSSVVQAQVTQSGLAPTLPSASAASYYYIAKPGEPRNKAFRGKLTMRVGSYDVWPSRWIGSRLN